MSSIKLTYFQTSGRGEPLRIIFDAGNIPFEDHRISFPEFGQMVKDLPQGAVPVITIDGVLYTQSNALIRYYGKQAGLYPEDNWEAYKCDEIMGATEDVTHKMVHTFGLEGDKLISARKALLAGPITQYVKLVETRLEAGGGAYVADNRFTVGDLKAFIMLKAFTTGFLEHVDPEVVKAISPSVTAYVDRIQKEPALVNYYAKQPQK